MAFSDPMSVTIDGTPTSLARVQTAGRSSTYETPDGARALSIAHTNNKRTRSVVKLGHKSTSPDPLQPSVMRRNNHQVYLVVDAPLEGVSDLVLEKDIKALTSLITSTGFIPRFLGQES